MTVEHESLRIAAPEDLPDQQSQRDGADLTFRVAANRYPSTNLHRTIPKIFKTQLREDWQGTRALLQLSRARKLSER
jgi:hypothetical protein